MKQGTESLAGFGSQLRIAIVGIDGRVQQWATSRHQPGTSVAKVPHDLFETINGIRDLLCSFEARVHCNLPSVVEGVSRKFFFALKVPVNPAFFQTSGSHEIGKCSAVVSFLIEDWRCLTNDLLPRLLAFAHVPLPVKLIQRPSGRGFRTVPRLDEAERPLDAFRNYRRFYCMKTTLGTVRSHIPQEIFYVMVNVDPIFTPATPWRRVPEALAG